MACSTAAKSSMKVIRSCSASTSLLYLCCARLRQLMPDCMDTLDVLPLPPGLRQLLHNKLGWVLSLNSGTREEAPDGPELPSRLPAPPSAGPSSSESDSEGCTSDLEACRRKRCRWTWVPSWSPPPPLLNTGRPGWSSGVWCFWVFPIKISRIRVVRKWETVTAVFLPTCCTVILSHAIQITSDSSYIQSANQLQ